MKTNPATQAPALTQTEPLPQLIAATANALPEQVDALARARAFVEPLLACETLDSGENTLVHADAVAAILKGIGGSEAMQAASYLVYACVHLNKPEEVIAKAFGDSFAALAVETQRTLGQLEGSDPGIGKVCGVGVQEGEVGADDRKEDGDAEDDDAGDTERAEAAQP